MRLPRAPETIRIRPKLKKGFDKNSAFLIDFKIRKDINKTAATDITINITVLFLKSPNAAPVFLTKVMWKMPLIIGKVSAGASLVHTRYFEN
jgi:hypothetical protein